MRRAPVIFFALNNTCWCGQQPGAHTRGNRNANLRPNIFRSDQHRKHAGQQDWPSPTQAAVVKRSLSRIQHPTSPYIIQAGWVINAALAKGIMKSDLPGDVHAQVTEAVYGFSDRPLPLIPQGSMLEGKVLEPGFPRPNSHAGCLDPDDLSERQLSLFGSSSGADGEGYAGLEDDVDEHWGSIFKAAVLSTILSVGAEAGTSDTENNPRPGDPRCRRLHEHQSSRRANRST